MYAVWKSQYEYIYYLFVFLLYNIEKKKETFGTIEFKVSRKQIMEIFTCFLNS